MTMEPSIGARVRLIDGFARRGDPLDPEPTMWLVEQWDLLHDAMAEVRKAASILDSVPDDEVAETVKGLIDSLTYLATTQAAELARKDAIFECLREKARSSKTSMVAAGEVRRLAAEGLTMPDPEPPLRDEEVHGG